MHSNRSLDSRPINAHRISLKHLKIESDCIEQREIGLGVLVEELLGLVDFGGQVRAATTIGVVQQHQLAVLLADLVLVQCAFPVSKSR